MSRIALVTGANKGIGLETSRQLAQAGVQVILSARDAAKGAAAAAQLRSEGLAVDAVKLDVTSGHRRGSAGNRCQARQARYPRQQRRCRLWRSVEESI